MIRTRSKVPPVEKKTLPKIPIAKPVEAPAVKKTKTASDVRKRGRPVSGREQVTLMISSDVLAMFKETGDGWRQLIDATLRSAMEKR